MNPLRNVANLMIVSTPSITIVSTMFVHLLRRLSLLILVSLGCIAAHGFEDEATDIWNWKIIGPFENYSGASFTKKLAAEAPFDTLTHKNARGGSIAWQNAASTNSTIVGLFDSNPEPSGAYLANTFVESRDRQTITLHANIAGSMEVYINDSIAFTSRRDILTYTSVPICRATLEKGWNRILVKAGNSELPFCFFSIMMMDASGNVIQSFASTAEPRLYPLQTQPPEPLAIPDSLYDMGYMWDDSFTDSLLHSFDDRGLTVNGAIGKAIQYKDQGLVLASLDQLRRALARHPQRYDAWFLKGYIHLELQQRDSAMYCFERGLVLDPGAYGPFMMLRKLKHQPDIFSYFRSVNTDSIIKAAFTKEPRDNRMMEIVLHDERIAVIAGGSSIIEVDQMFRMTNDLSISLFSKYTSDNISTSLSFSLMDYKYYGDSVEARSDGNALVLDNIEVGDIIRIRRRYIERDTLQIPMYFRHRHELQRRLYTQRSRYQIITPSSDRFQWRSYNTMAEPEYEETPLGYRLLWDVENVEPLPTEVDMPRDDLTGLIEVGTVPSWEYVAQRYYDAFVGNVGVTQKVRDLMEEIAPSSDSLSKQEIIQRVRVFLGNIDMGSDPVRFPHCRSIESIMDNGPSSSTDCATMFISMLAARDIKAHPMIIDTNTTPFHAPPTPSSATFNHVIIVIPGDSLPSFFDATARLLTSYHSLPNNVRGAFGLVLRKGLREPMYVANDPVMRRCMEEYSSITPEPTGTAELFQTSYTTEQDSSVTRRYAANAEMHSEQMAQMQNSIWSEPVPGTSMLKLCSRAKGLNMYQRQESDSNNLVIVPAWTSRVMYPDTPYDTSTRKTPLLRYSLLDSSSATMVIHAPPGYTFSKNQPRGIFNVESMRFTMLSLQQGDSLIITRKVVFTQPYVSPEGYAAFQMTHAKIIELDKQPVVLVPRPAAPPKRKKKK